MRDSIRRSTEAGFSLLELIVVISIITLLAGLLTPLVKSSLDDAKVAKILSQVEAIKKASMKYWYDMDTLAVEDDTLSTVVHNLFVNPGASAKWKGPYLDSPLLKDTNPWTGDIILDDDLSGADADMMFKVAGANQDGPGGQLKLTKVPPSMADKIDIALDGKSDPLAGVVETKDEGGGSTDKEVYIFLFKQQ